MEDRKRWNQKGAGICVLMILMEEMSLEEVLDASGRMGAEVETADLEMEDLAAAVEEDQVLWDLQAPGDHRDFPDIRDHRVRLERLEQRDHRDHKARLVHRVRKVREARLAHRARLVRREPLHRQPQLPMLPAQKMLCPSSTCFLTACGKQDC